MADESGDIVDPDDPRFFISCKYDGRPVPAQEWLSSAIDGVATVAQYETVAQCAYITGVSFSGNTAFHIGGDDSGTLLCGQISKTFIYLQIVILKYRKFMEIDFTLKYDDTRIGTGWVFRISSAESHNSNITTARITTP